MEAKLRLADINDVKVLQELNQEVFVDNYQYDPDLIKQAKDWARKQGYQKLFVTTYFGNEKAITFYKHNGLKEIDLSLEGTL